MSGAVAIFVKTPGHSALKTRLWPNLGREAAEHLHMACAEAVASVVAEVGRRHGMTAYWAVAEENAAAHWPGFPCIEQGAGSLGERMARVYRRMHERHGAAILIGADAPQIEVRHLVEADAWLRAESARLAIGPAEDGGFWLFGGNRTPDDAAWLRPRYSAPSTAAEFIEALRGQGDWLELERLRDIDTIADIAPVRERLAALADATAEQHLLLELLGRLDEIAEGCA